MTDDWTDVLHALLDAGVRFLVIGAHAMAVHGIPRGTVDLDVWVDSTPENAARVLLALASFGAPLGDLTVTREDFVRADTVVQLGLPPQRIDLMTTISGVPSFDRAWANRLEHAVGERPVPFLGRRELLENKRASGRHKDLADLESLGE